MSYDADILEFPAQTREDKMFNDMVSSMAESLGHPISDWQREECRSISHDVAEKLQEFDKEYAKERAKELKAMDKDPSLVQNDTEFPKFREYLDTLPPKIQQAALDLLQDSYRNNESH